MSGWDCVVPISTKSCDFADNVIMNFTKEIYILYIWWVIKRAILLTYVLMQFSKRFKVSITFENNDV